MGEFEKVGYNRKNLKRRNEPPKASRVGVSMAIFGCVGDRCYFLISERSSFNEAVASCSSRNMQLLSLEDRKIQHRFADEMLVILRKNSLSPILWLGVDQVKGPQVPDCRVAWRVGGDWYSDFVHCNEARAFICVYGHGLPSLRPLKDTVSWMQAKQRCQESLGRLASFNELVAGTHGQPNSLRRPGVWTDAQPYTSNNITWLSGERLEETNWHPRTTFSRNRRDGVLRRACVTVDTSSIYLFWRFTKCSERHHFICQAELQNIGHTSPTESPANNSQMIPGPSMEHVKSGGWQDSGVCGAVLGIGIAAGVGGTLLVVLVVILVTKLHTRCCKSTESEIQREETKRQHAEPESEIPYENSGYKFSLPETGEAGNYEHFYANARGGDDLSSYVINRVTHNKPSPESRPKSGCIDEIQRCYRLFATNVKCEAAARGCKVRDSTLLTLEDKTITNLFKQRILYPKREELSKTENVWLGIKPGNVQDATLPTCQSAQFEGDTWTGSSQPCFAENSVLCIKETGGSWQPARKMSWMRANQLCQRHFSHVVTMQELNMGSADTKQSIWLGSPHFTSRMLEWTTGLQVELTNWDERSMKKYRSDCVSVAMDTMDMEWTSRNCNRKLHYICQDNRLPTSATPKNATQEPTFGKDFQVEAATQPVNNGKFIGIGVAIGAVVGVGVTTIVLLVYKLFKSSSETPKQPLENEHVPSDMDIKPIWASPPPLPERPLDDHYGEMNDGNSIYTEIGKKVETGQDKLKSDITKPMDENEGGEESGCSAQDGQENTMTKNELYAN